MPRWFAALALGLIVLGAAGFSQSSWLIGIRQDRLFTQAERESAQELYGTSRGIRSDEWAVETPLVRAQQLAGFPLVNLNEGLGELQRNTYAIPVLDWGLAFRPLTWPYFAPQPWSHGLRWFLRDALLLVALYALLAAFVEDRTVAALAAVAIFFSSAFVWWRSTVMLEFIGLICLTAAVAARAVQARRPEWFALTAWCAACSFCVFYPPAWAPMLWTACPLVVDIARRSGRPLRGALAVGVIAAGAVLGVFYHLPYLSLVEETAYPGRRVATAGGLPLSRLVELVWPSLTAAAPVRCGPERYLGIVPSNVCEASSVEALPAAVLLAMASVSGRVRRAFATLVRGSPASVFALAVLAAWVFAPMPDWFGKITLLRWSPPGRAWMGFGVLAAMLTASLLAALRRDPLPEPLRFRALVGVAVVFGCAFVAGRHIRLEGVSGCYARAWAPPIVLAGLVLCAGAWLCGTARGATVLLGGWMACVVLANHRVNPLIRSSQLFAKGEGHRVVERALARAPGRILDYSTHPGAQLAAFGWPILGGIQNSPDLALFRFLSPDSPGLTEDVYNRYAHYGFELPPARSRLLGADLIRVALSPCSRRLAALGVNHLLTEPRASIDPTCAFDWVGQPAGELQLWTRREPVCPVGMSTSPPVSALEFDYSCAAKAAIETGVGGFSIEVPAGPAGWWSLAINPAVVGAIECSGASARILDAHLIVQREAEGAVRCSVRYLDSLTALRRIRGK
jgi:hypothetical protein